MTLPTLYPGMVNSPSTTLTSSIDDDDTTIAVAELSVFPSADNIAVIGDEDEESPETIKYTGKSAASGAGNLTGVERAFQGTAKEWPADTQIARKFTEYDYDAICDNIVGHDHTGGAGAAITEGALSLSDVTTADASSSAHGFCPKLSDDETEVLNGAGEWTDSPHRASLARQAIINGNFDIWQRGTAFTAASTPANSDDTYLPDRWILLSDGNDIVDVSRESTIIPEGSTYSLKAEVETANKKFGFLQIVESVDSMKFAGKSASLSFQARTATGHTIENVRASLLSWTGSPDLITSDVVSAWGAEGTNPTFVSYGASPLTGWAYSKQITINNTGSELTNYQLKFTINRSTGSDSGFTVYVGTNCESDYDDIRFTTSDGTTLCDYWIESSSTSTANIWVEVPTVTGTGNTTLYLYYGNSGATAVSNGDATFPFFDDFPGSSLDGDKWTSSGSITVSDSIVTITRTGGADASITGVTPFGTGYAMRSSVKPSAFGSTATQLQSGLRNTSTLSHSSTVWSWTDAGVTGKHGNYNAGGGETYANATGGASGVFQIHDVMRGSSQSKFKINNANEVTISTNYYTGDAEPFARALYANGYYIAIDFVAIHKYADTEPTISAWGSEVAYGSGWTAENTATNLPITTSWTTYKIEGIDIDTAGVKNIGVFIWVDDTDAAADDLLYLGQIQLCAGDIALPFEPKTYEGELSFCQRYYQRLTVQTENGTRWVSFPVTMRSSPTLTTDKGSTGNQSKDGFNLTHTSSAVADISATSEL